MPGHRRPAPSPSLADHARAWNPPGEDPGLAIDRAINRDDEADRSGRDAAAVVDAWNGVYPVGQAVIIIREDGTSCRGKTTVPAYLQNEDIPVVGVAIPDLSVPFTVGYWPLSRVVSIDELPKEWNPPTGGTDPWSGQPGDGFPNSSTLDAVEESAAYEADRRNGERERDAWNARVRVGREVRVSFPAGPMVRTRTSSPAYLLECGTPVVDVQGFDGAFPIRVVMPLTEAGPAPPSEAEAAAAEEVDAWNATHPIGREVIATQTDGTSYRGQTTSSAVCLAGDLPAVGVVVMGLPMGYWPLSQVEPLIDPKADLPTATTAALESERPGVLPVSPDKPGPRTRPDALAVLCHALGMELLALAEVRRDGKSWDDGHWRRLRGAIEAAGVVLDAGPRSEWEGTKP